KPDSAIYFSPFAKRISLQTDRRIATKKCRSFEIQISRNYGRQSVDR
ncbi:uncharacterized protein METZ01_LOCUS192325, partial [marine metagenome]